MNILSLIGTLLSLGALALAIAQGVLHKFVEVFIPTNATNPDDPVLSCSIAGLGIYTTVYDSSCLTPEVLASSRVPSEKFTSPTTTFKLLFPAQENFVAEVLPINAELLGTFDALFGAVPGQGLATLALGQQVAAIDNTEFETCEQYMTDIEANMLALFGPLNLALLPQIVPTIIGDSVADLKTAVSSVEAALSAPGSSGNVLAGLNLLTFFFLLQQDLATTCGLTGDTSEVLDGTDATCIQGVYGTAAGLFPTSVATQAWLAGLGGVFPTCVGAGAPFNTPQGCLAGFISSQITNNFLFAPAATFSVSGTTVCAVIPALCGTSQARAEIAGGFAVAAGPVLSSINPALLPAPIQALFGQLVTAVQGLGAYALTARFVAGPLGLNTATDLDGALNNTLTIPTFPATQTEFYPPCAILQIGAQAFATQGFVSAVLSSTPGTCGFNVFFSAAAEIAAFTNDPLADLVGALGELYGQCAVPLFDLAPTECHLLFPSIFISGAYSFDLNVAAFNKTNPSVVFDEGVTACEDDATDLEKVTMAQILFSICLAAYSLGAVVGVVSLAIPKVQAVTSVVAGLAVILGLCMDMGALLTVRSAPVYDSVSAPPEEDIPFYKEGIVVQLALITVIVSALTALVYFGAAFAALKGKCGAAAPSEGGDDGEIKEALATTMAKEDPEAKPSI